MPVYNTVRYVSDSVDSILGQVDVDFEFVIVDDGSTDGSVDILRRRAEADPRVRLTCKPVNGGYTNALRDALAVARGAFVARMDSDDVSLPRRLAAQVAHLRAHPECVMVATRAVCIDPAGREGEPFLDGPTAHADLDAWHMSGRGTRVVHPSVMVRRSALDRVGGYRPEYEPAEDFDLWLRLAEVGELAVLPDRLVRYRVHPQSVSSTRVRQQGTAMWRGVLDAVRRRGHALDAVPFADLAPDDQVNWIELALRLGCTGVARRWAVRRLRAGPAWQTLKHAVKVAVVPWSRHALPLYDRVRGRTARPDPFAS